MLKGEVPVVDLAAERDRLFDECAAEIEQLRQQHGLQAIELLKDGERVQIDYPVLEHPSKVTSLNFDKNPLVEGTLFGIKGQYLILDTGVINIRKFAAYHIEFEAA